MSDTADHEPSAICKHPVVQLHSRCDPMPHHGLLGLLIAWALLASLCDAHTCQGDSCALDSVMAARPTGGLLRIAVSQRGAASYSNRLLEEFTTQWRALNPELPVIDRDVQTIPHLSFDALEAGRADPASHSPTLTLPTSS